MIAPESMPEIPATRLERKSVTQFPSARPHRKRPTGAGAGLQSHPCTISMSAADSPMRAPPASDSRGVNEACISKASQCSDRCKAVCGVRESNTRCLTCLLRCARRRRASSSKNSILGVDPQKCRAQAPRSASEPNGATLAVAHIGTPPRASQGVELSRFISFSFLFFSTLRCFIRF